MDEMIDLFRRNISQEVLDLIPSSVAHENRIVPIQFDGNCNTLTVAMVDPNDFDTVEKLRFITNKNIEPKMATATAMDFAIQRYYPEPDDLLRDFH
jgi:type IV pilus assembly protein PilB